MKLIPGKYCVDENGMLSGPPAEFVLPLWDYIEMSLNAQGRTEKELIDLFDITPTALNFWKTGDRKISQDKLVILCNMFGVTMDQMLEGDLSDDYQLEDFYGLSKFNDKADPKKFSENELCWLFEKLNQASFYIEYFALGYIPLEPDNEFHDAPNKHCISTDEVEYYCNSFEMNITYDASNDKRVTINSIKYSELCEVSKILISLWGDKSYEHITVEPNTKYYKILLKSENGKALINHINQYKNKENSLIELWQNLKKEDSEYDKDFIMGKVLLSYGVTLTKDDRPDIEGTLELFRKIASVDVKKI